MLALPSSCRCRWQWRRRRRCNCDGTRVGSIEALRTRILRLRWDSVRISNMVALCRNERDAGPPQSQRVHATNARVVLRAAGRAGKFAFAWEYNDYWFCPRRATDGIHCEGATNMPQIVRAQCSSTHFMIYTYNVRLGACVCV